VHCKEVVSNWNIKTLMLLKFDVIPWHFMMLVHTEEKRFIITKTCYAVLLVTWAHNCGKVNKTTVSTDNIKSISGYLNLYAFLSYQTITSSHVYETVNHKHIFERGHCACKIMQTFKTALYCVHANSYVLWMNFNIDWQMKQEINIWNPLLVNEFSLI
jgi:hypothetical protein